MVELHEGDCRDWLPLVPEASIDAVICDPPYPHIQRPYGVLTEAEWWALIVDGVIPHVRRILKPTGSAVFILQPNSRKVGSMRGWLWEFMAWACREWNMVQDAWWFNSSTLATGGVGTKGLMRPSIRPCVWLGDSECYRDQSAVLKLAAPRSASQFAYDAKPQPRVSGWRPGSKPRVDSPRLGDAALRRGGASPFNLIEAGGARSPGMHGHGAGTPLALASWWTRYLVPKAESSVVCDPFVGSGTMALAALAHGASFVGGDKMPEYMNIARRRIDAAISSTPLFAAVP
jgi:hypothetical protein